MEKIKGGYQRRGLHRLYTSHFRRWQVYLETLLDCRVYNMQCMLPLYQTPIDSLSVTPREAREGWPLLIVEAEANGVLRSTNERGPSLVGSFGSACRYRRFLSCLGCSGQPSTKYFSSRYTISIYMSLSPSNLGRQSCKVACLWMCVSGHTPTHSHPLSTASQLITDYHREQTHPPPLASRRQVETIWKSKLPPSSPLG
jgi:hypothetical protein